MKKPGGKPARTTRSAPRARGSDGPAGREFKPRGEFKPRAARGDAPARGEFKPRGEYKPRAERGARDESAPRREYKPRGAAAEGARERSPRSGASREYGARAPREYTPRAPREYTPRTPREYTPRAPREAATRDPYAPARRPAARDGDGPRGFTVTLDPDVARVFRGDASVNKALRLVLQLVSVVEGPPPRDRGAGGDVAERPRRAGYQGSSEARGFARKPRDAQPAEVDEDDLPGAVLDDGDDDGS